MASPDVLELRDRAKLAEQCDRFEDMAKCMKQFFEQSQGGEGMSDADRREDRNLLSVAYKNVVGSKRAALRILQSMKNSSSSAVKPPQKAVAKELIEQVETELRDICMEVVTLVRTSPLSKNATDAESKVFYDKLVGDYYRYMCEAQSEEEELKKCISKAEEAYKSAEELAKKDLLVTHPIRLGLALNASVFYYEIMKNSKSACDLAKQAFDDAIAHLDEVQEDSYKDSTLIMQLLRDNLTLWSSAETNENDNENDED